MSPRSAGSVWRVDRMMAVANEWVIEHVVNKSKRTSMSIRQNASPNWVLTTPNRNWLEQKLAGEVVLSQKCWSQSIQGRVLSIAELQAYPSPSKALCIIGETAVTAARYDLSSVCSQGAMFAVFICPDSESQGASVIQDRVLEDIWQKNAESEAK